ncbi:MAG: sulfurtransferase [Gammaproteobacteria bacterium]|nr:sulfurtransferase [Gammaproteobacteria bacterium]
MFENLAPSEFVQIRDNGELWQLLDVREQWEIDTVRVSDSIHISMNEITARYTELDAAAPVAVLCHSGGRSARVAAFLVDAGFARVANIAGGIDAWAETVDRTLPRY